MGLLVSICMISKTLLGKKKIKSQIHNKNSIDTPMKIKICKAIHMYRKYKKMERREIGCRKGTQVD